VRPVNLIPPDQRRGGRGIGATGRTGNAAYIVLGGLALALLAVGGLALTSHRINDRKQSVARLSGEQASAQAAADALQPYGKFAEMQRDRVATIKSLADTSFNWERIMRSVSRAIPPDAWLTSFTGTVRPGVSVEGTSGGAGSIEGLRSQSSAPALELVGCTYSHRAVARMMTRMRNIDGVTQVVLGGSERPQGNQQQQTAQGGGGGGGGGATASTSSGDCRTKYRITQFSVLVVLGELAAPTPSAGAQPGQPTSPVDSAKAAAATVSNSGGPSQ